MGGGTPATLHMHISSMSLVSYSVTTDVRVVLFNIPQPLDYPSVYYQLL